VVEVVRTVVVVHTAEPIVEQVEVAVEVTRIVVWTPTPEGAEADDDPVDDYLTIMADLASAYETLGMEFAEQGSIGNVHIEEADWRAEVGETVEELRAINEFLIEEMEPPEAYATEHGELLEAVEALEEFAALLQEGIDQYEAGDRQQGEQSIAFGAYGTVTALEEIISQMEAITE
jgi:hypothetical protein